MKAARQGRGRLVSGLLRAGADLQATDEEGNTVSQSYEGKVSGAANN